MANGQKSKFNVGDRVYVKTREECEGLTLHGDFVATHAGHEVTVVDIDWTNDAGFMYAFAHDDEESTMEAQLESR